MKLRVLVSVFLAWTASAAVVRGDGGTLRFSHKRDGYQITLFTAPSPLRAGPVDFSVLVQDAGSGTVVRDLSVTIHLYPIGTPERSLEGTCTEEAATNKLFHAVQLELPEPGGWQGEIRVQGRTESIRLPFEMEVAEPVPPWVDLGLWIAWPFAVVVVFAIHQLLVRRHQRTLKRESPP